jgi:hypothetical protein
MDTNADYDDAYDETEIEEAPRRRSPLRFVLLVLLLLVLLCVVCWFGSSLIGGVGSSILAPIQELLPGNIAAILPGDILVPAVTEEIPTGEPVEPAPTDEGILPPLPTEEPFPSPDTGEQPATVEPPTEATQEPGLPTVEATSEPVPGPTNTPDPAAGPTIVITPSSCEDNVAPVAVANGPYAGMRGKGQAFITFDAAGSEDPDGTIISYEWDFGDDSAPGYGLEVTHGYANPGSYVAILTVTDNCNVVAQDTAEVTISGPTPPAQTGTPDPNQTPTPIVTVTPPANDVTLGFCYIVQYGNTLSGIAWYYGIPLQDLAYVNNVSPNYFVKLGEGLFIPYQPISEGPNSYQVQYGDTIQSIAYQCAVSPGAVAEANDIPVDSTLTPGEVIIIPLGRY